MQHLKLQLLALYLLTHIHISRLTDSTQKVNPDSKQHRILLSVEYHLIILPRNSTKHLLSLEVLEGHQFRIITQKLDL